MTATRWLVSCCLAGWWAPATAGTFNQELLHSPVSYRDAIRVGYAMDAPYLAKMFDASPDAARDLSTIRAGSILVTGAVVGPTGSTEGIGAVALETNRSREVRCILNAGQSESALLPGSVVSVTGRLLPPEAERPFGPALIAECEVVWSSQDVVLAAATALWCAADRIAPEAGEGARRRGSDLLVQAGLREPPTGCNEGLLIILNECLQGVVRRECDTSWVRSLLNLMVLGGPRAVGRPSHGAATKGTPEGKPSRFLLDPAATGLKAVHPDGTQ